MRRTSPFSAVVFMSRPPISLAGRLHECGPQRAGASAGVDEEGHCRDEEQEPERQTESGVPAGRQCPARGGCAEEVAELLSGRPGPITASRRSGAVSSPTALPMSVRPPATKAVAANNPRLTGSAGRTVPIASRRRSSAVNQELDGVVGT